MLMVLHTVCRLRLCKKVKHSHVYDTLNTTPKWSFQHFRLCKNVDVFMHKYAVLNSTEQILQSQCFTRIFLTKDLSDWSAMLWYFRRPFCDWCTVRDRLWKTRTWMFLTVIVGWIAPRSFPIEVDGCDAAVAVRMPRLLTGLPRLLACLPRLHTN